VRTVGEGTKQHMGEADECRLRAVESRAMSVGMPAEAKIYECDVKNLFK